MFTQTTTPTWFGRTIGKTGEAVKEHPIAAIGLALGLGYFLGFALAGRSRSMLVRTAAFAVGSAAVSVARERVTRVLAMHARSWLDERDRQYAPRATA